MNSKEIIRANSEKAVQNCRVATHLFFHGNRDIEQNEKNTIFVAEKISSKIIEASTYVATLKRKANEFDTKRVEQILNDIYKDLEKEFSVEIKNPILKITITKAYSEVLMGISKMMEAVLKEKENER